MLKSTCFHLGCCPQVVWSLVKGSVLNLEHHQTPLTCLAAAAAASSPLLIKLRTVQNRTTLTTIRTSHLIIGHTHNQTLRLIKMLIFTLSLKDYQSRSGIKSLLNNPRLYAYGDGGNYPQKPSLSGAGIVAVNIAQLSCHYNLQLQPELFQFYEVQDI